MRVPDEAIEAIHGAICEESLEDHMDPAWPGRCVKAAKAAAPIIAAQTWTEGVKIVTTIQELDALAEEAVVLDKEGTACQKAMPEVWSAGAELITSELFELPATVLWEPQGKATS